MAFDHIESPALRKYNSHCRGMLHFSGDAREAAESDCPAVDGSATNVSSSFHGGHTVPSATSAASAVSAVSDLDSKMPDVSDSCTPASVITPIIRPVPRIVRTKTIHDLECEECLRRLHSLTVGDSVYLRRCVLGLTGDGEGGKSGDYVEGRVVCFSFDLARRYVVVALEGYGLLKFTFGDLFRMSVDKNAYLQRLQHPGALAKSVKQKRQRLDYEDDYLARRSCGSQLALGTEESDNFDALTHHSAAAHASASAASAAEGTEVRTRPVPPGVESFCKCRFINKVEFVRKLRALICQSKQSFYDKTASMQELRLIMTQNVRAYELEMVAYLLGEDPWSHSSNPFDQPTAERVQEIIEQYTAAVSSPEYIALFSQWQKYTKAIKNEAKAAAAAAAAAHIATIAA